MNKPPLVAFIGYSRSGKDTLAKPFIDAGYRRANMALPMKQTIERLYSLPDGAMEDDTYRNRRVPRSTKTYLEMMVSLADMWRSIDPYCMATPMERLLRTHVVPTVTTGIRFLEEIELLSSLDDLYTVTLVHTRRPGVKPLQSDRDIGLCLSYCGTIGLEYLTLENDGTLADWETQAAYIYDQVQSLQASQMASVA